jgi:hypothetical protein
MIRNALGMVVAAVLLLLLAGSVTPAPCWYVFTLVCLLAWPIWRYRTEYLLFRRRLVLAGAVQPVSRIRILLWKGSVTRILQVAVSIPLAWVLLALVTQLSGTHGYLLVLDAVLLSLVMRPVTRQLQADIKTRHLGIVARRWPLFLINGIVLTGAIMALDFFVAGADDTRRMAWHLVAEQAFARSYEQAGCVLWGLGAGGMAAFEALSWHLSELVVPALPGTSAKIIAWSFFLLRAVTVAWLYTAMLLGVCIFLDAREERRAGRASGGTFSRSFFLTIVILALPFFYAAVKLAAIDPDDLLKGVGGVADSINPCKPDAASRAQLVMQLDKAVADNRQAAIDAVDSGIDQGLERIFVDIEARVDDYLDWYFTVFAEYQRLAAVFTADATDAASEKLEEYLFTNSEFAAQLDGLERGVEQLSIEHLAGMVPGLGAGLDNAPCDIGSIDLAPLAALERDNLRASAAVTSGVGAGIVTSKLLAKKTAAVVIGKVAAKKSVQGGAALASKALAKKGASSALSAGLGVTLCAPAGPMAILCGVTAGVVTWLSVDKTLIEIDEALHREEMRTAILEALAGQQVELGAQLKLKHRDRIDRLAAEVSAAVQKTFIPYRDGMGP